MNPTILQPILNPIKYQRIDPAQVARYVSKHYLDYSYHETIDEFEEPARYTQPWMISDVIRQQLQATINPVQIFVVDCKGRTVYSNAFTQKQRNVLDPSLYIYEHTMPLALFDEGIYFIKVVAGTINYISEPIEIKNVWENSLLLEYSHYRFYGDVIFETGFTSALRVLGSLKHFQPASKDTTYEDQSLNQTLLHSVPYRVWPLVIGSAIGIPDYLMDKINLILGCSNLQIDGRYYTKAEGSRMEPTGVEFYPMRGYRIDMREKYNRMSVLDSGEATMTGVVMIAAASDTKGFGTTNDAADAVLTDAV